MKLSLILDALSIHKTIDADPEITGLATLGDAGADQLSYAVSPKHRQALQETAAGAVLIVDELKSCVGPQTVAIVTPDPELSMAYASRLFRTEIALPRQGSRHIDPTATIFPNVSLGSNVSVGKNSRIMPGVYLGDNVVVGEATILYPNCVVYHDCRIGNRCILHANTVVGSDGFGYAHTPEGEHVKIEQMGRVIIEDDVEIGSNTSIDRATFNATIIRRGAKLDNLVHISHNVEVGEHTIIAGQTGIAGSTTLGRNVVMAAQSGATGHIKIADFSRIAARGGVSKNTEPGKTYAGFPLLEHQAWLKYQAKLIRLAKKTR